MNSSDPPVNDHHSVHSDSTHQPTPPAQAPGSHLPSTASAPGKPPRWHHRKRAWLAIVVSLAIIGTIITIVVVHRDRSANELAAKPPPSGSTCPVNGTLVPLNTTVGDGYFDITLLRAIYNPPASSPPLPAPGREYLEADFAVTTTSNTAQNTALGIIYEPSIVPPGYSPCSIILYPIQGDIHGNSDQSITDQSDFRNPDFTPLAPGTTVDVYALFSIPIGDKNGRLEWESNNASGSTFTFKLH